MSFSPPSSSSGSRGKRVHGQTSAGRLAWQKPLPPLVGRLLHDLTWEHAGAVALGHAVLVVGFDTEQARRRAILFEHEAMEPNTADLLASLPCLGLLGLALVGGGQLRPLPSSPDAK
jgi:hypothetical protein